MVERLSPDIVELVTNELLAHGEFSSIPDRNRTNAAIAALAIVDMVRATHTGGVATETMRELAQQLLDAAHYSTELTRLEGHCRDVARKLENLAEGQPCSAGSASLPHPNEIRKLIDDFIAPDLDTEKAFASHRRSWIIACLQEVLRSRSLAQPSAASERLYSEEQISAAVEKVIDGMLDRGEILRPRGVAQGSGWQPIETVPKDRSVMVYAEGVVGEAYYDGEYDDWWWENTDRHDYTGRAIYPTLWQPMPTPPVPSTDRGGQ